jgi:hypothetical protein
MKRGKVSSRETKSRLKPVIIRASVNGGQPEAIRVLKLERAPEDGESFQGVPSRFSNNFFKKTFRVLGIEQKDGLKVFECTTG